MPLSHPFVERLVGAARREYLDQTPFWIARDLERKLDLFQKYYNCYRVHQGLKGQVPDPKAGGEDQPAGCSLPRTGRGEGESFSAPAAAYTMCITGLRQHG